MKKETQTRGHGKEDFFKNLDFIVEGLRLKKSVVLIYKELQNDKKISIDGSLFRRYVRELKENLSQQNQHQTKSVSFRRLEKDAVSGTSPASPDTTARQKFSAEHPEPDQTSVFKPEPIADMDAEFASDEGVNNG